MQILSECLTQQDGGSGTGKRKNYFNKPALNPKKSVASI